ncbi:MAG: class F sortase [Nocardioidaceae bacterium]|nr:class F sortase [Nocardioidaceae bacterium]MCL2614599.1 class F sortase [Nocardioidaceae bacterium]
MHASSTSADRRRVLAAALLVAGLVVIGVAVAVGGLPSRGEPPAPPTLGGTPSGLRGPAAPAAAHVARPVWIRIPAIRTHSRLLSLGIRRDREMQVPTTAQAGEAGWYRYSPRPGQDGPAVVIGHVDSVNGPAIFYRLSSIHRGDVVRIGRADGSVVRFRVTAVALFDKAHFGTDAVYDDTRDPELRLITCGGTYDPSRGGYQSNVVVFARRI